MVVREIQANGGGSADQKVYTGSTIKIWGMDWCINLMNSNWVCCFSKKKKKISEYVALKDACTCLLIKA